MILHVTSTCFPGVLPLASGDCAQRLLQAQFAGRLVRKEYICLCEGPFLGEKCLVIGSMV